jgi:hypothetical protein
MLRGLQKYIKGCVNLKKYKSQGKAVQVTGNNKAGNSYDLCLDFVQEFGLCTYAI